MGMYTGLRVKVYVKEEYREMIEEINNGAKWSEFAEQFPFSASYSEQSRAESIPRGSLSYMPDEWEEGDFPNGVPTDGFDRYVDMETGYWTFQCSLKNYEGEIEQFLKEVLPNIIEKSEHIEVHYEEWDFGVLYKYKNGKIVETEQRVNYEW